MKTLFQATIFLFTVIFIPVSVFAAAPNNVVGEVSAKTDQSSIQLSWPAATNFDGTAVEKYRVYVDIHSVPDAENYATHQDTTGAETTYTLTKYNNAALQNGTKYFFSVTALNAQGEESPNYSQEASVTFGTAASAASTATAVTTTPAPVVPASTNTAAASTPSNATTQTSQNTALLQVVSAVANSKNTVTVTFNKALTLPQQNPETAFSIQSDTGAILAVQSVSLSADKMGVVLTTADQADLAKYTVTARSSLTDTSGKPLVSGVMDQANFIGTAGVPAAVTATATEETLHGSGMLKDDTTPPEDVTNFKASYKSNAAQNAYNVLLKWTGSVDSAKDLDHQNFQQKVEDEAYSDTIRIEKDKTSYEKVLAGGKRYTFKISTLDATGNESTGAITSIILPETGPAALLGLIGMMSAGATYILQRKRS